MVWMKLGGGDHFGQLLHVGWLYVDNVFEAQARGKKESIRVKRYEVNDKQLKLIQLKEQKS